MFFLLRRTYIKIINTRRLTQFLNLSALSIAHSCVKLPINRTTVVKPTVPLCVVLITSKNATYSPAANTHALCDFSIILTYFIAEVNPAVSIIRTLT